MDLYLELFYINGEIDLEFFIENNKYYFIMKHEIKECAFVFEVIDWIRGKEKEQKTLNISLKNQGDLDNFIAFNLYNKIVKKLDRNRKSINVCNVKNYIVKGEMLNE